MLNAKSGVLHPVSPEGVLSTVYLNKIGLLLFAYINASMIAWLLKNRASQRVTDSSDE
jgi:voltage-gated potassium channel